MIAMAATVDLPFAQIAFNQLGKQGACHARQPPDFNCLKFDRNFSLVAWWR
jgi:hypothetical protein